MRRRPAQDATPDDGFAEQQARLLTAEEHLRQNSILALGIAKDISATLKQVAPSLPNRPSVYLKDRNSEQEYDVRYHVGIAQTFRSGPFRSFRYKLLQIHLHGNFKSVIARITEPAGHTFEQGIPLTSRDHAAEIFSAEYLARTLKGQLGAAEEAFLSWKSDNRGLGFGRERY